MAEVKSGIKEFSIILQQHQLRFMQVEKVLIFGIFA